ncbi:MAG: asparagine synthetase B, partial [Candidatus Omnitrophica bacterium]|nr:asparagine synthetase B [Candidatus Omnitrophota bacterium]
MRAYGVAYWALEAPRDWVVEWVLNYRGGAFIVYNTDEIKRKCILEGVTVEPLSQQGRDSILKQIESSNMELVTLEKAPKVAIYAPPNHEPWDDAVTLALEYSKIPYDKIWDPEVLSDEIQKYDWVHLHHEDFTGQYGKFYRSFRNAPWYRERVRLYQQSAKEAGFDTVAEHKRAVTVHIANYVSQGGFLFAMCSACDTIDIALSAEGIDIIEPEIDGTPMTAGAQDKLRYDNCLMFEDFTLYPDPMR